VEFYKPLFRETIRLTTQSAFFHSGILWSPFPFGAAMLILLVFVGLLFFIGRETGTWVFTVKKVTRSLLGTTAVSIAALVLVFAFEAVVYAPYAVLKKIADQTAVQTRKQVEQNHLAQETVLSKKIDDLQKQIHSNPMSRELAQVETERRSAVKRAELDETFIDDIAEAIEQMDQAQKNFERAVNKMKN
jgi:hypothetical protein